MLSRSKLTLIITLIILGSVSLVACSQATPTPTAEATPPPLALTNWRLVSMNDVPVEEGFSSFLIFADEEGLYGYSGCNLFTSSYELMDSQINISPVPTSARVCDDNIKAKEEAVILVLNSASNYALEGQTLKLTNPDATRRATYEQMEPFPLEGTSWVLSAYNDGQGALVTVTEGSEISIDFAEGGQLSGTSGCNNYNASYEVDRHSIVIGPVASTLMACDQPEGVMEQESNYLRALENAQLQFNLGLSLILTTEDDTPLAIYFVTELD